ncbi:MAG: MMPL family transporter [Myxococcota bacterium]|nr:MMPL family transporter [Myxococcota bacterium]
MIVRLMRYVAQLPLSFPKSVVGVCAILTALAIIALPRLHVSTDRNLLAGKDNAAFKRREAVNDLFGTSLVAVVVLEGQNASDGIASHRQALFRAADQVADALARHPEVVRDVFHKADISFFEQHALLFLPVEMVEKLPGVIDRTAVGIDLLAKVDGLPALVTGLAQLLTDAPAPVQSDMTETRATLAALGEIFNDVAKWFSDPETTGLSIADKAWQGAPSLSSNARNQGYLTDRDGEPPPIAVLFVQPASNAQDMAVVSALTDLLRKETATVLKAYPGVTAKVTGMPALITDEMRLVSRDSIVAGVFSGLGVLLVFILAFRSIRISLFLVLPLGVGLIWSAGFTAVVFGHLTMITSYFAAVLFGIGVAFTIHLVARCNEALVGGTDLRTAIDIALTKTGPGVVVGGTTTAVAFFAIAMCEFKGFAEMGIISGVGVTLILITNLTLLPAALLLWHPGARAVKLGQVGSALWADIARSRIVVPLLGVAAMIGGGLAVRFIQFDYAVENLLPSSSEAVQGLRTLDKRTDFSMNYSIALADTPAAAEQLRQGFQGLSTVSRAESLSMFVPEGQEKRLAILSRIRPKMKTPIDAAASNVAAQRAHLGSLSAAALADAFQVLADTLGDVGFDAQRSGRGEAPLLADLEQRARAVEREIRRSGDDDRAQSLEHLIFEGLSQGLNILGAAINDKGFGIEDLPEAIRRRYRSSDGAYYSVITFPNGDIGDRAFLDRHVAELISVSEETTGHPVTHLTFTRMVHEGFRDAVILAALAVVLLVLLDLRTVKGLILALLPVLMGLGATALVMATTGFKFNYANLMALPILIGTGVDYGVHLAHRTKQEGSIAKAAQTTGRAIALTGLTTLIGFGSLLLGNHWGVKSLGLILVIGIFLSLVAALVAIPGAVKPAFAEPTAGLSSSKSKILP